MSVITQGAALGYELLPFQGVWGKTCETCIYKISYQILFGFTVEYVLVRKKFFFMKKVSKYHFFLLNVEINN